MTVTMKPKKPHELLLSLPDELLVEVIAHLGPKFTVPLHSTCRRLRALTRLDPVLWQTYCEKVKKATSARPPTQRPISEEEAETIDWYTEYKFRYAPTRMRWIGVPGTPSPGDEVIGIGAFSSRGEDSGDDMVVSPMADGSVRLWSLRGSNAEREGREVGRSAKGVVFAAGKHEKWATRKARDSVVVDGVSVDGTTGRMWVAGEAGLVEIDLTTLRKVSTHRFPFSISTLSQTSAPYPLTVGTTSTLHLHDPRVAPHSTVPSHVHLFQPSPLSILHSPDAVIHVAGRFPSLLAYDRRKWPRLASATYSGASLCGLAHLGPDSVVACGEYNGRGALEVYPGEDSPEPIVRNRQTAARSKILTVAAQGTYIVTGNAGGCIRFFERDARTLMREHWVDGDKRPSVALWGAEYGEDVVRKVKPLGGGDGEFLVWAGDKMGVLGVRREMMTTRDGARGAAVDSKDKAGDDFLQCMPRLTLDRGDA